MGYAEGICQYEELWNLGCSSHEGEWQTKTLAHIKCIERTEISKYPVVMKGYSYSKKGAKKKNLFLGKRSWQGNMSKFLAWGRKNFSGN